MAFEFSLVRIVRYYIGFFLRLQLRASIQFVSLAATARERVATEVLFDHHASHFGAAPGKRRGTFMQRLRVLHVHLIVLHVLGTPAARMRDIRKLRKLDADLCEETEHLARHRLYVVL